MENISIDCPAQHQETVAADSSFRGQEAGTQLGNCSAANLPGNTGPGESWGQHFNLIEILTLPFMYDCFHIIFYSFCIINLKPNYNI